MGKIIDFRKIKELKEKKDSNEEWYQLPRNILISTIQFELIIQGSIEYLLTQEDGLCEPLEKMLLNKKFEYSSHIGRWGYGRAKRQHTTLLTIEEAKTILKVMNRYTYDRLPLSSDEIRKIIKEEVDKLKISLENYITFVKEENKKIINDLDKIQEGHPSMGSDDKMIFTALSEPFESKEVEKCYEIDEELFQDACDEIEMVISLLINTYINIDTYLHCNIYKEITTHYSLSHEEHIAFVNSEINELGLIKKEQN